LKAGRNELGTNPALCPYLPKGVRWDRPDRIESVVQHLLNINDPDFMLNKVIEIEAQDRFSVRELPSQKRDGS
jgi:hypothetical protein